jgi:ketosteroid isomerase-like protein
MSGETTAGTQALAALHRFYAAEERYLSPQGDGDFGPIAETLDPEVVMYQAASLPYGGEWRGHDGFERWSLAMREWWSSLSVQDPQVIVHGATLIVLSTVVATARRTGREYRYPLAQVIETRGGRILSMRPFYWDTAQTIAVLTEKEPPADPP